MLLKLSLGKHNGGIQSDLFICFLKVGKKKSVEIRTSPWFRTFYGSCM